MKEMTPPNDIEAEQSLLGIIITDGAALHEINTLISVNDFYDLRHQIIYKACIDLDLSGMKIDLLTVNSQLQSTGMIDTVGGARYIAELTTLVMSIRHICSYAKIIKKHSRARAIIQASDKLLEVYDGRKNADTIVESAMSILNESDETPEDVGFEELHKEILRQKEEGQDLGLQVQILDSCEKDWCSGNWNRGLKAPDMNVISANPGGGKTQLLAELVTQQYNHKIIIFSIELSAIDFARRIIMEVDRTYNCKERDYVLSQINKNFKIVSGVRTVSKMRSYIARMREKPVGICIDHFHHLSNNTKFEDQESNIEKLGNINKDFDLWSIILCQVNVASRKGKEIPSPKGSGKLEEEAAFMMHMIKETDPSKWIEHNSGNKMAMVSCIVSKNRYGQTGMFDRYFIHGKGVFSCYTRIKNKFSPEEMAKEVFE